MRSLYEVCSRMKFVANTEFSFAEFIEIKLSRILANFVEFVLQLGKILRNMLSRVENNYAHLVIQ